VILNAYVYWNLNFEKLNLLLVKANGLRAEYLQSSTSPTQWTGLLNQTKRDNHRCVDSLSKSDSGKAARSHRIFEAAMLYEIEPSIS
jgi:hypothetical protein